MYIRQQIMLSFEEIEIFSGSSKLELILSEVDLTEFIPDLGVDLYRTGPKGYSRQAMLYALMARIVEQIPTIKGLYDRLKQEPRFRYICGFDPFQAPPSEATFSRFARQLAKTDVMDRLFIQLRDQAREQGIILEEAIALDSTHVPAFEKAVPRSKCKKEEGQPSWSVKTNSEGNQFYWFGWKVHIICDAFSGLPVEIKTTSAHHHDSVVAVEILKQLPYKPLIYTLDKGYDTVEIYDYIVNEQDELAIIPYNYRSAKTSPEGMTDKLAPMCSGGYALTYWGRDGDRLKYRCPHVMGDCNCPHGTAWCSSSNYGYTQKVKFRERPRLFPGIARTSKKFKELSKLRSSVERCNHRLKNHLMLESLRSSGIKAADMHFKLCATLLIAGTIAVNRVKNQLKAA